MKYLTLSGPPGVLGEYKVPIVVRPSDQENLLWFQGIHGVDSDTQKEVEFEFESIED